MSEYTPVKVRWLKTIPGIPVYTGVVQIVEGETAILDPSEAGRAIANGWAERVVDATPKTRKSKAKEQD